MSNTIALKSCNLFRGFSETTVATIGKIVRNKSIPAGTPVFVENMVADAMFVITKGRIDLSIKNTQGQEILLDIISENQAFGELSLLLGRHRLLTATAAVDCKLLEISRRDFAALQKQKPKICLKLMIAIISQVGHRLSDCREHLKSLLLSQVRL